LEPNLGILGYNKEVPLWDYENNLAVIVPKSGLWRHFSPQEGKRRRNNRARNCYRVKDYEQL
jgi:hypothetical protein